MHVKETLLYQEMMRMQQEAANIDPSQQAGVIQDFGLLLRGAINNVNELQQDANSQRTAFEMGSRDISLSEVMIAAQKSSIAFEATAEVRNKLVEAYKTIMNMSI